ncbi:hypothetical protein [Albidovulum sediminis]|uniref:Uncharacterized protein n=1 Tax=Albidovulum sediminis TaxID=3066345 RepID=A0ABT2NR23_9RHOB|nr:hypothetical protein [Defluviimonas sediminis]MCT8331141.1 hypothetical protein [Defluviimonas sediminis]
MVDMATHDHILFFPYGFAGVKRAAGVGETEVTCAGKGVIARPVAEPHPYQPDRR